MQKKMDKQSRRESGNLPSYWLFLGLIAFTVLFGIQSNVSAFEINTGNEDVRLRWDNTVRYNYGYRVNDQKSALIGNANNDDGNRNFDKGTVTNRVDVLSEMDFVYKKNYGARVSAAAWYDYAYQDENDLDNNSVATSNHFENGAQAIGFDGFVDKYYAGPDSELLDAFVFGNFNLAGTPLNVKVGRHSIFWGESMLLGGAIHGIAYSQSPLDTAKGFAVPGVDVKELFRPLNNISAQIQPSDTLSIAAQYYFEWEQFRAPESGTFLSPTDAYLEATEALILGPNTFAMRGRDVVPDDSGDWGIMARWTPEVLEGGTLGLYYRNFSDKLPQLVLDTNTFQLHDTYASDIDLYGISLAMDVKGVSLGAELSYRENMPLNSDLAMMAGLPSKGNSAGARGNTFHGVANLLGLVNETPLFDSLTWLTEFTWNRWDKVTENEQLFMGRSGRTGIDAVDKNFFGFGAVVTPTWFQALPGLDVSLPLTYTRGISGNSSVLFGGTEGAGTYSVGLVGDLYQKYNFTLKYSDYFGDYDTDPVTGALTVANGLEPLLCDRGAVTFTFKTTF